MGVLRQNRDTLLSVLEPFLRDPTVSWHRSGRAQRLDHDPSKDAYHVAGGVCGEGRGVQVRDIENELATEMLRKIGERLKGVYNLTHPYRDKLLRQFTKRLSSAAGGGVAADRPVRGMGVAEDEAQLPLSIQGQVEKLYTI